MHRLHRQVIINTWNHLWNSGRLSEKTGPSRRHSAASSPSPSPSPSSSSSSKKDHRCRGQVLSFSTVASTTTSIPPSNVLRSDAIESYWKDFNTYIHDPSFNFWAPSKLADLDRNAIRDLIRITIRSYNEGNRADLLQNLLTRKLCEQYLTLDLAKREQLLDVLALDFNIDAEELNKSITSLTEPRIPGTPAFIKQTSHLREVLTPTYERLFNQVSKQPQGIKFLVDIRADLLKIIASRLDADKHARLSAMETNLRSLLASWIFGVGFLELQRITWNSPATLLEKIFTHEAVHRMASFDDLKRRLGHARRCYGYFHPSMPGEPLVFVKVALTDKISDNIHTIIDHNGSLSEEHSANTAIFYSISSTQKGLQGIELGTFLIKRVIDEIKRELPSITTFSTLSPIPGFLRWLQAQLSAKTAPTESLFLPHEILILSTLCPSTTSPERALQEILSDRTWFQNVATKEQLKPVLMRLCARYLYVEKVQVRLLDPVANFHIRNGAEMYRLNWEADKNALQQSAGMMVNYRYDLETIEQNYKQFLLDGTVSVREGVSSWLHVTPPSSI